MSFIERYATTCQIHTYRSFRVLLIDRLVKTSVARYPYMLQLFLLFCSCGHFASMVEIVNCRNEVSSPRIEDLSYAFLFRGRRPSLSSDDRSEWLKKKRHCLVSPSRWRCGRWAQPSGQWTLKALRALSRDVSFSFLGRGPKEAFPQVPELIRPPYSVNCTGFEAFLISAGRDISTVVLSPPAWLPSAPSTKLQTPAFARGPLACSVACCPKLCTERA